jgi:hypothetical protein
MKQRQTAPHRKKQSTESLDALRERIRQRAYALYELRGKEDGRDFDDWLQAESEVTGKADQR